MKPTSDFESDSLDVLKLAARSRRACEELGAQTVGDVRDLDQGEFLAIPGCGPRTWQQLQAAAEEHLAQSEIAPEDRDRSLISLVHNARAERAFFTLGLRTVGDFLRAPKKRLLEVPGFGRRTYDQVLERIRSLHSVEAVPLPMLPVALRDFPIHALGIEGELAGRLACLGCTTVGRALTLPSRVWGRGGDFGLEAAKSFTNALDAAMRTGTDNIETAPPSANLDYAGFKNRLFAPLDREAQQYLIERVGIERPGRTLVEMAASRAESPTAASRMDEAVRNSLLTRAPGLIGRLRDALTRELEAFEGIVTGEHLATGSLAHTIAKGSGDRQLPLRLLVFLFPRDFYLHEGYLTSLPRSEFQRLWRKLKRLTAPHHLPVSLESLEQNLEGMPRGLLQHLLRSACHLSMVIDANLGEIIQMSASSHSARLQSIFRDGPGELHIDDVVFHFRDRFGRANKGRLLTQLRRDSSFLEIGDQIWTLREQHIDDLEMASLDADRIALEVNGGGGIHQIRDLVPDDTSERRLYLTIDCLRRNPSLRNLGRGAFCAAMAPRSQVMERLMAEFRRAMGEVPMERFIQNHPPERRRLVRRLLQHNRAFVSPAPDRIDVITNYPFTDERMRRFLAMIDRHLENHGGYSTLEDIRQMLSTTDLGGSWLGVHLLHDLLRRHKAFELLPGGLVARDGYNLAGWIQARARDVLRDFGDAVTIRELLAEAPDLAEFEQTLGTLLDRDPMVLSREGQLFKVL